MFLEESPVILATAKRTLWSRESAALWTLRVPFAAQLAIVFCVAATVYLLLRTADFLAVDGALRGLEVYQLGRPFLHPNHHLLYPVDVYWWITLLSWLGIHATGPVSFLSLTQAMNAIAGAGVVTILYGLCYRLTKAAGVACMVTIAYGLSRAFLAHATNSAEPMVGLFWSSLSIVLAVYGVAYKKIWACIAAGVLLALTTATYQSMALIAPAVAFWIWRWPRNNRVQRHLLLFLAPYMAGFAVGVVAIFGVAFYWSGTHSMLGMVQQFMVRDAYLVNEGGITLIGIAGLLAGLAYALFPCLPRECTGFRCLATAEHQVWIPVAVLAIVVAVVWLGAMLVLVRRVWPSMTESEKVAIVSSVLGLCSTITPAVWYHLSTYDKLWLEPLACLLFASGTVVAVFFRRPRSQPTRARTVQAWSCAAIAILAATNVARVPSLRAASQASLANADELATLVKDHDLLVGDWNDIFLLYQAFWAPRANTFNVPSQAIGFGPETIARLADRANSTRISAGNVYFLGLLDLSPEQWRGSFAGKPLQYSAFDLYRQCAQVIKSFRSRDHTITLRRLARCPGEI